MLDVITPLILTYNEAPNIGRALEQLSWAREIVVVDSFSDDGTLEIISSFSQARVFQREFDSHEKQWNFGLKETGILTEWIMALDADYVLSPEVIAEIKSLRPPQEVTGYRAAFLFCINGRKLRSAVYPPVTFLYRRKHGEYLLDGHTQRVKLNGHVDILKSPILHDDRKSLGRWFNSQKRYQQLEARKILTTPLAKLDFADRVRRLRFVAPVAVFLYCLFIRGAFLDGRAGWFYSLQRMAAEMMLSLFLLDHDLRCGRVRVKEKVAAEFADLEERNQT